MGKVQFGIIKYFLIVILFSCERSKQQIKEPFVFLIKKENGQTIIFDTISAETDVKAIIKGATMYTNIRRQEIKFGEMDSEGFIIKNFEGVDVMNQHPESFRRMVDSMVNVNIHRQ